MFIEKILRGVLEFDTPIGPRYLRPNLFDRALLTWTFRNFSSLPQEVLRGSERRLVDRLWKESRFLPRTSGLADLPLIGIIERRAIPVIDVMPEKKPAASSKAPMNDEGRQAISA